MTTIYPRRNRDPQAPRTQIHPGEAIPGPPEWTEEALCASISPELWFPDHGARTQQKHAIAICHQCPVRLACLEESLTSAHAVYGVWGGVGEKQRGRLRAQRRKAA